MSIVSIPLLTQRELTVSELPLSAEIFKEIGQTANEWKRIAGQKRGFNVDAVQVFETLERVAEFIGDGMKNPDSTGTRWNKIYICEDVALEEIQAIALVYVASRRLYISFIATHPRNVRSKVNLLEPTRVDGAASTIIYYLAATLPSHCKDIYVAAAPSAKAFYQNVRFDELNIAESDEPGCIPMSLGKKKLA